MRVISTTTYGLGGFSGGVSSRIFLSKKKFCRVKEQRGTFTKRKIHNKKKWWDDWTTVLPLMNWWRIISDLKWVRYFIFYFFSKENVSFLVFRRRFTMQNQKHRFRIVRFHNQDEFRYDKHILHLNSVMIIALHPRIKKQRRPRFRLRTKRKPRFDRNPFER